LAFKIVIFTDRSHKIDVSQEAYDRCDWLSKLLFLRIGHTFNYVVDISHSCDWLSKLLFLRIGHTGEKEKEIEVKVVIGFQNCYFYG
jgi:hypothetical protein